MLLGFVGQARKTPLRALGVNLASGDSPRRKGDGAMLDVGEGFVHTAKGYRGRSDGKNSGEMQFKLGLSVFC